MCTRDLKRTFRSRLASLVAMALFLMVAGYARLDFAQTKSTKTFSSAEEASNALFQAAQNGNEQGLEAILGTGSEVTSSGDLTEDKLEREQFTEKYQQMHRLVREADGNTILYIGAENWPFPIPLVTKNGTWHFDSDSGKQEILFRTVGENESTAIQVCEEFAIANTESSAKAASEDPITQFAERLAQTGAGDAGGKEPILFHGYYFRIVTQTSAAATPSVGRKTGGLTLVSYPAQYKSTGVMTFVVNKHGVVYEKDLGPGTPTLAPVLKARSGSKWRPAA
jgi:Protein of unknown function (DUF2950)